MTMFEEAAARVQERIDSAPVDEYLRVEASRDLTRLTEAYHLDLAEMQERNVKNVTEASLAREYVPSEYDMRRTALEMAVARFQGVPAGLAGNAARDYYKFLKGE